jgi:hypothetical protein
MQRIAHWEIFVQYRLLMSAFRWDLRCAHTIKLVLIINGMMDPTGGGMPDPPCLGLGF